MSISRKLCKLCGRRQDAGWYISTSGMCRPCAVAKVVDMTNAMFPPDPEDVEVADSRLVQF